MMHTDLVSLYCQNDCYPLSVTANDPEKGPLLRLESNLPIIIFPGEAGKYGRLLRLRPE